MEVEGAAHILKGIKVIDWERGRWLEVTVEPSEPLTREQLRRFKRRGVSKFDVRLVVAFTIGCVLAAVFWFPIHFFDLWEELASVAPQFVAASIAVNGVFLGFLPTLSIFMGRTLTGMLEAGHKILADISGSTGQRQKQKQNIRAMGEAAQRLHALADNLLGLDQSPASQILRKSAEWGEFRRFGDALTRRVEKQLKELEAVERKLLEYREVLKEMLNLAEEFRSRLMRRYHVGFWLIAGIVVLQSLCLLFCYGFFLYPAVTIVLIGLIMGVTVITTLFEPMLFLRSSLSEAF